MFIQISQINMAGLSPRVIHHYSNQSKVKQMIIDLRKGDILPPIVLYKEKTQDKFNIADGIHRLVAYLSLNRSSIEVVYIAGAGSGS